MINQKILITGARGFVGSTLSNTLEVDKYNMIRCIQSLSKVNWSQSLTDVETVVHLADRVHIMQDKLSDPLAEFRAVNLDVRLIWLAKRLLQGLNGLYF